jgi:hypothetical protein
MTDKRINNELQEKKMQIDGLSKKEITFLNTIWACDGEDQFMDFFLSLNEHDRKIIESLMVLLNLELNEELMMTNEEFPESNEYLKRFQLNGHV